MNQMLKAAAIGNSNDEGNTKSAGDSDGATKSRIMYKSFLTSGQVNHYLLLLLENRLLNYDKKTAKYKITDKGLKFLEAYDQIGDAIRV
jgi:predicted transcriptional regulator